MNFKRVLFSLTLFLVFSVLIANANDQEDPLNQTDPSTESVYVSDLTFDEYSDDGLLGENCIVKVTLTPAGDNVAEVTVAHVIEHMSSPYLEISSQDENQTRFENSLKWLMDIWHTKEHGHIFTWGENDISTIIRPSAVGCGVECYGRAKDIRSRFNLIMSNHYAPNDPSIDLECHNIQDSVLEKYPYPEKISAMH